RRVAHSVSGGISGSFHDLLRALDRLAAETRGAATDSLSGGADEPAFGLAPRQEQSNQRASQHTQRAQCQRMIFGEHTRSRAHVMEPTTGGSGVIAGAIKSLPRGIADARKWRLRLAHDGSRFLPRVGIAGGRFRCVAFGPRRSLGAPRFVTHLVDEIA